MIQTPWSDGVPGVSQREIRPGEAFLYKWTATQYGEYWYHAHNRGQIDDGQFGPLIIHPKDNRPTPFGLISKDQKTLQAIEKAVANIQPLVLSDWRNIPSEEAWDIEVAANTEIPCYDSLLINGKGKVDCWSASKIASLMTPDQAHFLQLGNFTALTAKAYVLHTPDHHVIEGLFFVMHELTWFIAAFPPYFSRGESPPTFPQFRPKYSMFARQLRGPMPSSRSMMSTLTRMERGSRST